MTRPSAMERDRLALAEFESRERERPVFQIRAREQAVFCRGAELRSAPLRSRLRQTAVGDLKDDPGSLADGRGVAVIRSCVALFERANRCREVLSPGFVVHVVIEARCTG